MPHDDEPVHGQEGRFVLEPIGRRLAKAQVSAERLAELALMFGGVSAGRESEAVALITEAARLEHELFTAVGALAAGEDALHSERAEAARLLDRARRYERVAAALCESLTSDQVAAAIAIEVLEALGARTVAVLALDAAGERMRLCSSVNVPPGVPWSEYPLETAMPSGEVVRTGQSIFLGSLAEVGARFPLAMSVMRHIHAQAMAVVPVRAGGAIRGAIAIAFPLPRIFEASEKAFATALGQLCAQAMLRARLFDEQREARDSAEVALQRLKRLQRVTSALCRAMTVDQVTEMVVTEGLQATGAFGGGVVRVSEDGREVITLRAVGVQAHLAHAYERFPRTVPCAPNDVLDTGEPVFISDFDTYIARYPGMAVKREPPWMGARAAVPMIVNGVPIGALTFIFEESRSFPPEDQRFFLALADQCAQALERARLVDAARV